MMEFRGLSRFGRLLQAVCHIGMDVRTYDRWRNIEIEKYITMLQDFLDNKVILLCYDNYNKQYGNPRVDLSRDTVYTLVNVCVVGISLCQTDVDMQFIYEHGVC